VTDTLIIFIDSLRADATKYMPFLARLPEVVPIRPGIGYSINLHAELFAGLQPDEVGFFCEWHLSPEASPGYRLRRFLPLLDTVCRPYLLNRAVQHLLTRGYRPDHVMPNIPLRHIDKFAIAGEPILSPRFPAPTLFTRYPTLHVLRHRGGVPKGHRDTEMVEKARAALPEYRQMYVPLPDLDGITHDAAVGSPIYIDHLRKLDGWLATLHADFRRLYPEGHFFIVSDHGMANVERRVALDLEKRCGRAKSDTYLFFTDSTLLRVWILDPKVRSCINDYLATYPYGHLLTSAERATYGLTNPSFGDFILILSEGVCFEPSYFARHAPRAMHGYHPELSSQWAVYAHEGPSLPRPRTLIEVYDRLDTALHSEPTHREV